MKEPAFGCRPTALTSVTGFVKNQIIQKIKWGTQTQAHTRTAVVSNNYIFAYLRLKALDIRRQYYQILPRKLTDLQGFMWQKEYVHPSFVPSFVADTELH